jgi:hypothetical protein|nr:MAG TPA: hypothetical protein [Crassvirales sp.]
MERVFNGMSTVVGHRQFYNAHLFYKGRSIIIDYEWCLHAYDICDKINYISEGLVPFEVYPHGDDIYVGYLHTDSQYKKADIGELISILDDIIENEDKYITPEFNDFDYEEE